MKKHHAYVVKWKDSASLQGWHGIDDPRHNETPTITSVGWLIKNTPKTLTITTSVSEGGRVMDALSIPREAVTKLIKLPRFVADNT